MYELPLSEYFSDPYYYCFLGCSSFKMNAIIAKSFCITFRNLDKQLKLTLVTNEQNRGNRTLMASRFERRLPFHIVWIDSYLVIFNATLCKQYTLISLFHSSNVTDSIEKATTL